MLASATMLVTVVSVTLLVGGCGDMEFPLGDTPLSLPALSYVAGTAEQTLTVVAPVDRVHGRLRDLVLGDIDGLFTAPARS
eukprot:6200343-Prymnesium_polylepis.1